MYKLIAIDLDGTLLNSYGEVSAENRDAIKQAQKQNIEIILASGRPLKSTLNMALEINASNYLISDNGATVYDIQNNQFIYNSYLPKQKVLEIIKMCDENSISYSIYTESIVITQNLNYNVLFYYNENKHKEESKRTNINVVDSAYEYVQKSDKENFSKITICDSNKSIFGAILNKLKTINNIDVLDVEHMSRKKIINRNWNYRYWIFLYRNYI